MKISDLKKLLAERKQARVLSARIKNSSELELMLYGEIGQDFFGYGIGAQDVADQIKQAGQFSSISLRINSPGGDVFEGAAIYNLIASQKVPVTVTIDGLAASAASYIAMVGNKVSMGQGAMIMIHNPWTLAIGDADDLRAQASVLDKVRDSMLSGYMRRYKGTQDELISALNAETWMTAEDAMQNGFCDEVITIDPETDAKAKAFFAQFDLSLFKNAPDSLKEKPKAENDQSGSQPTDSPAVTDVERAPTTPAENGTRCSCPCGPCMNANCDECTMNPCTYDGCGCESHMSQLTDTSAATEQEVIAASHDHRTRLLHLASLTIE